MGNLEPFTGVTVTGQILKEGYTLNWRNQELIIGQKVKSELINIDTKKWKQNISMLEIVSEDSVKNVQSAVVRGVIGNITFYQIYISIMISNYYMKCRIILCRQSPC
ncbi:hypothetical protein ACT4UL_25185 [Bacillus sp. HC-TM]